MDSVSVTISLSGKAISVPSIAIGNRRVIVTGKWVKMMSIEDEEWLDCEAVENPQRFIAQLKETKLDADIFTFAQKLDEPKPNYDFHMEWDNVAAIPITSCEEWLKRVSRKLRQDVTRAKRMGVSVREETFDDRLVQSIVEVYNADPIRQGKLFWHYGKDFEVVKKENATYLDRSTFIGAYFGHEPIGFLKMVHCQKVARLMQIVAKSEHYAKRPQNALIAKAVEICVAKECSHLVYDKFVYGSRKHSSLAEFKHRNGFEEIRFPRYYIPLNLKGRVIILLRLHRGIRQLLPERVQEVFISLRSTVLKCIAIPMKSLGRWRSRGLPKGDAGGEGQPNES